MNELKLIVIVEACNIFRFSMAVFTFQRKIQ